MTRHARRSDMKRCPWDHLFLPVLYLGLACLVAVESAEEELDLAAGRCVVSADEEGGDVVFGHGAFVASRRSIIYCHCYSFKCFLEIELWLASKVLSDSLTAHLCGNDQL